MTGTATSSPQPTPEELAFPFRSGRLSLNFSATLGMRWRGGVERLRSPDDLARWYREAGLLSVPLAVTPAGLDQARILREAIDAAARALACGERPTRTDETVLNSAAARPPLVPRLSGLRSELTLPETGGEEAALSTVARDAVDLLTGPQAARIRECASDRCSLLFVDLSRPGLRRWCSSALCGSRQRSAGYRERHRQD